MDKRKRRQKPAPRISNKTKIGGAARKVWKEIMNVSEGISKRNWLSLGYTSPHKLTLIDSGEKGLDEAKRSFQDDDVRFCVLLGCQEKSKDRVDLIQVMCMWIPESIQGLKRAQTILDIDQVAVALNLEFYILLGCGKKSDLSNDRIAKLVSKRRGGVEVNPGDYHFDENVFKLRKRRRGRRVTMLPKSGRNMVSSLKEFVSNIRLFITKMLLFRDHYLPILETRGYPDLHATIKTALETISNVIVAYYDQLRQLYSLPPNENDFEKYMNEIGAQDFVEYITENKIGEILKATHEHLIKNLEKSYSPYLHFFPKLFRDLTNIVEQDSDLRKEYDQSCAKIETLLNIESKKKKKGSRRFCDFSNFLFLPVQNLLEARVLFIESMSYACHPSHPLHKMIKKCLEDLKMFMKSEHFVETDDEESVMEKTIKSSELFSKNNELPILSFGGKQDQKLIGCKEVDLLDRKKLSRKKNVSKVSGKSGELLIFEKTIVLLLYTSQKRKKKKKFVHDFGYIYSSNKKEKLGKKFFSTKSKVQCQMDLTDPNIRCSRHPLFSDVAQVEDEEKKVVLRFSHSADCEDMVSMIQSQIRNCHQDEKKHKKAMKFMTSLYATRVLHKSVLTTRLPGDMATRSLLHLVCADMKIKVYDTRVIKKGETLTKKMLRSYSLVGSKYGRTTFDCAKKQFEKDKVDQEDSSLRFGPSPSGGGGVLGGIMSISGSGSKGFMKDYMHMATKLDSVFDLDNDEEEEKKNKDWFYITLLVNVSVHEEDGKVLVGDVKPSWMDSDDEEDDDVLDESVWIALVKEDAEEETEGEGGPNDEKKEKKATKKKKVNLKPVLKKVFFRTENEEDLETWMGLLQAIGCCKRIDDANWQIIQMEKTKNQKVVPKERQEEEQEEEEEIIEEEELDVVEEEVIFEEVLTEEVLRKRMTMKGKPPPAPSSKDKDVN